MRTPKRKTRKLDPKVEDFRKEARETFAFLLHSYGFSEEPLPEEANPFSIRLANATTRILIEGINWGMNARVAFGRKSEDVFDNYDLGDLLPLRCPQFQLSPEEAKRGQIHQLARFASALRECEAAVNVLTGDFSIIPELDAVREQRLREWRDRQSL